MPTLSQLVNQWTNGHQSKLDDELNYYKDHKDCKSNAAKAILLAAKGRGENNVKLDHQHRLNLNALDNFATLVVAASYQWPKFSAFPDLFNEIQKTANGVHGIGDLAVYDTALRIGWHFGVKPDQVYLQADALKGAKQLEKKRLLKTPQGSRLGRSAQASIFPSELHPVLDPYQIENFLCVFCDDFCKIQ